MVLVFGVYVGLYFENKVGDFVFVWYDDVFVGGWLGVWWWCEICNEVEDFFNVVVV